MKIYSALVFKSTRSGTQDLLSRSYLDVTCTNVISLGNAFVAAILEVL